MLSAVLRWEGTAVGASRQLFPPQLGDKRSGHHDSYNPVPSTMNDTE